MAIAPTYVCGEVGRQSLHTLTMVGRERDIPYTHSVGGSWGYISRARSGGLGGGGQPLHPSQVGVKVGRQPLRTLICVGRWAAAFTHFLGGRSGGETAPVHTQVGLKVGKQTLHTRRWMKWGNQPLHLLRWMGKWRKAPAYNQVGGEVGRHPLHTLRWVGRQPCTHSGGWEGGKTSSIQTQLSRCAHSGGLYCRCVFV
jgi:hypothetical protein